VRYSPSMTSGRSRHPLCQTAGHGAAGVCRRESFSHEGCSTAPWVWHTGRPGTTASGSHLAGEPARFHMVRTAGHLSAFGAGAAALLLSLSHDGKSGKNSANSGWQARALLVKL